MVLRVFVGLVLATFVGGHLGHAQEESDGEKELTFKLDSLSGREPIKLQHGALNVLPVNVVDTITSKHSRIADLPEFPLIATLRYETVGGSTSEKRFENAYRC